jgi:hypothetical protein
MPSIETLLASSAIATPIIAAVSVLVSIVNRHHIQQVHLTMNSRMDELLKSSSAVAHASGVMQGRAEIAGVVAKNVVRDIVKDDKEG